VRERKTGWGRGWRVYSGPQVDVSRNPRGTDKKKCGASMRLRPEIGGGGFLQKLTMNVRRREADREKSVAKRGE